VGVALLISEYAEWYLRVSNTGTVSVVLGTEWGLLTGQPARLVHFPANDTLEPGQTYVVASSWADSTIRQKAAFILEDLQLGSEGAAIVFGTDGRQRILDAVGPGGASSMLEDEACGVPDALTNYTLIRKASIVQGNGGDWQQSAGTNAEDCEWSLLVVSRQDLDHTTSFEDLDSSSAPAPAPWPMHMPAAARNALPSGLMLLFSEYAEGLVGTNDRYLEILNTGNQTANLSTEWAFPNVANSVDVPGVHEYFNTFPAGAALEPGATYIIAHAKANEEILAKANFTHNYLSNGNDGFALVYGNEASYTIVDAVGDFLGDPGPEGWSVCGIAGATRDHALLRKPSITEGNWGNWSCSAGSTEENCGWIVVAPDDWSHLGLPSDVPYVPPITPSTSQEPGQPSQTTGSQSLSTSVVGTPVPGSMSTTQAPNATQGGNPDEPSDASPLPNSTLAPGNDSNTTFVTNVSGQNNSVPGSTEDGDTGDSAATNTSESWVFSCAHGRGAPAELGALLLAVWLLATVSPM